MIGSLATQRFTLHTVGQQRVDISHRCGEGPNKQEGLPLLASGFRNQVSV